MSKSERGGKEKKVQSKRKDKNMRKREIVEEKEDIIRTKKENE